MKVFGNLEEHEKVQIIKKASNNRTIQVAENEDKRLIQKPIFAESK